MRYKAIVISAVLLLCFSDVARSQQTASAGNQPSASPAGDCFVDPGKSRVAEQSANPAPTVAHLDQDSIILNQKQTELAQCILKADAQGAQQNSPRACTNSLLLNFEMRHDGEPERDVPIGRLPGNTGFFYESGMTIDADGAPNAYHPDNTGLDDLANAGNPGVWEGLAKNANGEPIVQGPNDPFPGYYVSSTALADRSKAANDPARYVDASKIPFVVLPGGMARQLGARPGDFAAVFNPRNGKSSFAIFGDVGPFDRIGEGSMALADSLGIRSDARNGGARRGILYLIFPGSGNGSPRTIEEINAAGQRLLLEWESFLSPDDCAIRDAAPAPQGNRPPY